MSEHRPPLPLQDIWAEDGPWEHEAPGAGAAGGGAVPGRAGYESDEGSVVQCPGINTYSTGLPMGMNKCAWMSAQNLVATGILSQPARACKGGPTEPAQCRHITMSSPLRPAQPLAWGFGRAVGNTHKRRCREVQLGGTSELRQALRTG